MGYTSGFRGYLSGVARLDVSTTLKMGSGAKLILDASTSMTDAPLQFDGDPNTGICYTSADAMKILAGGDNTRLTVNTLTHVSQITGLGNVAAGNGFSAIVGPSTFAGLVNYTPPAAQSITGVGVAITATGRIKEITSDGNYTLTVAPTIANGTDGQMLTIVNVGANTVTIQDQGTLASSNLRLTGASVAIGPRDSLTMYYSGDVGDWVQIGPLVSVV